MLKSKKKLFFIAIIVAIMLISIAIIAKIELDYQNTCFPQISLNDEWYSGKSKEEARELLKDKVADTYKDGMTLIYGDQTFQIPLSEIGIQIDTEKSINNVFSYGHRSNILTSLIEQIGLLENDKNFQNELVFSDSLIGETGRKELSDLETLTQNFSYKFDGEDFQPTQPNDGFIIDEARLKEDIEKNLLTLTNNPVKIEMIVDKPKLTKDSDKTALEDAKNLIERQIVLEYDSTTWEVSKEDFGVWIDFTPTAVGSDYKLQLSPDKEKIEDYLISLVPQINSEPVNAQLEFNGNRVEIFALSQEGISLDTKASAILIGDEIFQEENYTKIDIDLDEEEENDDELEGEETEINRISIRLVTEKVQPELTTENMDNMGITSLLATGESNFYGSTNSRKHNIAVGASKFNGVLIGPGEEFSFNDILGNVGAQEGYLPELVIKQGETVPEYGGGLCQVSTTAFRGAVSAGLEITERKNHAYAVSYYSPQGTDATIYPPHPDLAFINNTPAYILIQTRQEGNNLYFDFYGTDDGRKVELEGPVTYQWGEGGARKTWWKQTVYDKDGNLFLEDTFYSDYKSASLYPHTNPLE